MSKAVAVRQFAAYLEPLTQMQRVFVQGVLGGMSDVAAATAAGVSNPRSNAHNTRKGKAVSEAISKGMEIFANEVFFDRKTAHDMLMDAHSNSATTTEQVLAVRELIKLHGVAAPEVKEIHQHMSGAIEHREVRELSDEQLLKLAQLPTEQLPAIIDGEYEEVARAAAEEPKKVCKAASS